MADYYNESKISFAYNLTDVNNLIESKMAAIIGELWTNFDKQDNKNLITTNIIKRKDVYF